MRCGGERGREDRSIRGGELDLNWIRAAWCLKRIYTDDFMTDEQLKEEDPLDVSLRRATEEADYADRKLMKYARINIDHLRRIVGQCRNFREELKNLRNDVTDEWMKEIASLRAELAELKKSADCCHLAASTECARANRLAGELAEAEKQRDGYGHLAVAKAEELGRLKGTIESSPKIHLHTRGAERSWTSEDDVPVEFYVYAVPVSDAGKKGGEEGE